MSFTERLGEKQREILRYLIVGVCTTVVALAVYYLCADLIGTHYQAANVISWIFAVAFAYVTNKKYVFRTPFLGWKHTAAESAGFMSSRVASLLIEMFCMYIGVRWFHIDDGIMKLIDQVIVTVLNYVFSKFFVFRNRCQL